MKKTLDWIGQNLASIGLLTFAMLVVGMMGYAFYRIEVMPPIPPRVVKPVKLPNSTEVGEGTGKMIGNFSFGVAKGLWKSAFGESKKNEIPKELDTVDKQTSYDSTNNDTVSPTTVDNSVVP